MFTLEATSGESEAARQFRNSAVIVDMVDTPVHTVTSEATSELKEASDAKKKRTNENDTLQDPTVEATAEKQIVDSEDAPENTVEKPIPCVDIDAKTKSDDDVTQDTTADTNVEAKQKPISEEQKEEFLRLFKECDMDNNGSICEFEMFDIMVKYGMKNDEEFRKMDTNKDNKVTYEEFEAGMTKLMQKNKKELVENAMKAKGKMSKDDLLVLLKGVGLVNSNSLEDDFGQDFLKDSGDIDFSEFDTIMNNRKSTFEMQGSNFQGFW